MPAVAGDRANVRSYDFIDVYTAPVGTTLPTDVVTALNASFTAVGLLSEDELTRAMSMDRTELRSLGGRRVRVKRTGETRQFTWTALENTDKVFKLANPGSTSVTSGQPSFTLTTSAAADDIIDTTAPHGFAVNDRVVFTALTGGTGLTTGTVYYVIAANLGAQTFQVSTTQGGSAAVFSADITAGTVGRAITTRTYKSQSTVELAMVIVAREGTVTSRFVIPRTEIFSDGDTQYGPSGMAQTPMTAMIYPNSSDEFFYDITDDPGAVV
jgi:hypothetical protein